MNSRSLHHLSCSQNSKSWPMGICFISLISGSGKIAVLPHLACSTGCFKAPGVLVHAMQFLALNLVSRSLIVLHNNLLLKDNNFMEDQTCIHNTHINTQNKRKTQKNTKLYENTIAWKWNFHTHWIYSDIQSRKLWWKNVEEKEFKKSLLQYGWTWTTAAPAPQWDHILYYIVLHKMSL
jgi:hypothetical protein